jgi:Mrp family chromosome partitioning ATPase
MRVLRSPQTVVHVVTLLEDMPVQETADAVSELTAVDMPVGGIIVNQVRRTPLDAPARKSIATGSLPVQQLVAALETAGLGDPDQPLDVVSRGLLSAGEEHVARLDLEDRLIGDVEELGRPVYQLPHLSGDIDLDAIYELARELREQGLA